MVNMFNCEEDCRVASILEMAIDHMVSAFPVLKGFYHGTGLTMFVHAGSKRAAEEIADQLDVIAATVPSLGNAREAYLDKIVNELPHVFLADAMTVFVKFPAVKITDEFIVVNYHILFYDLLCFSSMYTPARGVFETMDHDAAYSLAEKLSADMEKHLRQSGWFVETLKRM